MHYWIRLTLLSIPFFFVLPYLATSAPTPQYIYTIGSSVVVSAEPLSQNRKVLTNTTRNQSYKSYNLSFDYYRDVSLVTQKKLEQQRIEKEQAEKARLIQEQLRQEEIRKAELQAKQAEALRIQREEQAKAAQQIAQQQVVASPVVQTAPTGDLKGYAYNRICEVFGCDNWQAFDFIITRESGWNPLAVNRSSGACGLGQSLPCSKMSGYGADYATNGTVQVNWTIDYIKNRYGNPNGARVFWNSHNWY
jgi:hypothetical protein